MVRVSQLEEFPCDKRMIQFSIEDTGIGIKEEDMDKLFKIFGKVHQSNNINP
jgi:signal transduction histidine kinase